MPPTISSLVAVGRCHLPGNAPHSAWLLGVKAERRWLAELTEAALEVLIQEGIEYRIQAAVHIAQSNKEMHHDQRVHAAQIEPQRLSQNHDLDGGPTDDERCHHHQYHPGDTPQIAVFFLGTRQDANVSEAFYHQAVADADDGNRDEEGEEEDASTKDRLPVLLWFRDNHNALNTCRQK